MPYARPDGRSCAFRRARHPFWCHEATATNCRLVYLVPAWGRFGTSRASILSAQPDQLEDERLTTRPTLVVSPNIEVPRVGNGKLRYPEVAGSNPNLKVALATYTCLLLVCVIIRLLLDHYKYVFSYGYGNS